jgi:hypothetical protein
MDWWEIVKICWLPAGLCCYIIIYLLDIALESIAPEAAPFFVKGVGNAANCFLVVFLLPFPIGLGTIYLALRKVSEYSSIR